MAAIEVELGPGLAVGGVVAGRLVEVDSGAASRIVTS
jgi:hypothetical protein